MKLLKYYFNRRLNRNHRFRNSSIYYRNKYILFPILNLWMWIGNNRFFGETLFERHRNLNEVGTLLEKSMKKVSQKYPNIFETT